MATQLTQVTFPNGDYIRDTNTTYSAGTGLSLSGTTFSINNSGISPFEANLQWGGKNFSGSYGCIDAALMDELGANRFQFIKASAITVEYSRDGGSTWTDYGATDAQKQQIFAQGGGLAIGKADSTHKATEHPGEYQLRITIDTGEAHIYSYLNKFVIYVSTNGSTGCLCKIQKALQNTPTTFIDHTDWVSVTGWSGYNVLNTSYLPTYGNSPSSQYGRVRFIFKDGVGGNTNYNGLAIIQIKAFGGVGWSTPSTMAKTGHLYSYTENQSAVFPNFVYAAAFYENNVALSSKYFALSGGTITGLPKFAAGSISEFSGNVPYILGIEPFSDGGDVKWKKSDYVSVGSLIETDYTYTDYARHGTGSQLKTVLTRQNRCGIGTSSAGGLLLASNWLSNSYNAELYMGMGDNLCMYYRGINNNTYTDWYPVGRFTQTTPTTNQVIITDGTTGGIKSSGYTIAKSVPSDAVFTDTKNTAGSTDTSSKIFLIGATSQAANPQTYSQDTVYVGTDGCLYSGGTKVLTSHQDISGKADKSATVSTVTWDSTNKKLTKTINGSTTDVVTGATILGGLTKSQVTTALGYTPPTTDTDEKVKQTETSTNAEYEVLFSGTADSTTRTEGVGKDDNLLYNPSSNTLQLKNTGISNSITPSSISLSNSSGGGISIDNTNNKIEVGKSGTSITYSNTDVVTSNGNTWDGNHTSLKDALTPVVVTSSSVNLNNYTSSGKWIMTGKIGTKTNFPAGNYPGELEVVRWSEASDEHYCRQDFKIYNTNMYAPVICSRIGTSSNGTSWNWSAWYSENYMLPNETLEFSAGYPAYGFITTSGTEMHLYFPVYKYLNFTNGVKTMPSSISCTIRQNGKYIGTDFGAATCYPKDWYRQKNIMELVVYNNSNQSNATAWKNATNNCEVVAVVGAAFNIVYK